MEDKERLYRIEQNQYDTAMALVKVNTGLDLLVDRVEKLTIELKEVKQDAVKLSTAYVDFRSKVLTIGSIFVMIAAAIPHVINFLRK